MSKFTTELCLYGSEENESLWRVGAPLSYESDILGVTVTVPAGFMTDLASVPRLPFIYLEWGSRAHREGVIHDYLYRIDSAPVVSFKQANAVFKEAMASRGKPLSTRWAMWAGVWIGGWWHYHKHIVAWIPTGKTRREAAVATPVLQIPPDTQTIKEKLNEQH